MTPAVLGAAGGTTGDHGRVGDQELLHTRQVARDHLVDGDQVAEQDRQRRLEVLQQGVHLTRGPRRPLEHLPQIPVAAAQGLGEGAEVVGEAADVLLLAALGAEHRQPAAQQAHGLVGVGRGLPHERRPAVEQRLQLATGVAEHLAELLDDHLQALAVDRAHEVVHVDQQVALVDRQRRLVALEHRAVLRVRRLLVARLEVEVLLTHRRQVVHVHGGVGGEFDVVVQGQLRARCRPRWWPSR